MDDDKILCLFKFIVEHWKKPTGIYTILALLIIILSCSMILPEINASSLNILHIGYKAIFIVFVLIATYGGWYFSNKPKKQAKVRQGLQ